MADPDASTFRRAVRAIAVDLRPLRESRDFRRLWSGGVISVTGQEITIVALFVQIYALTHSPAAVGLVGAVEFVPLLLGTIVGGPLIDRYDRRRLLAVTQTAMAASAAVLLLSALAENPPLWPIYAAAAVAAGVSGVDAPTRSAMTPNLVGKELLPAAINLNFAMWNIAVIIGPAIGGVVVGVAGLAWAYGANLVTYAVAVLLVLSMHPARPQGEQEPPRWLRAVKEGFAYLRGRPVLQSSFTIDIFAMVFGLPEALFPVLAALRFHGGPGAVGALFSSAAVGALVATLTAGWIGRVKHQGLAVIWAVVAWGAAITAFGLASDLWVACLLLAVAGGADSISAVFRSTILQSTVPDELRGRLSSIHFLVVSGGPRLGNLESGVVAQLTTPTIAVVSGGLLCILGALGIALFVPAFRTYHAGDDTRGRKARTDAGGDP